MDYKKLSIIILLIVICAVSAYFIFDCNGLNKESVILNLNKSTINDAGLIENNSSNDIPLKNNSKPILHYGYWVSAQEMKQINLTELSKLGTTDIFLNYYVFSLYSEEEIVDWINLAHFNGIKVHIWMQCFYKGEWVSPMYSNGTYKYNLYNELTDEALYYASVPGVDGIHLDYVRFDGDAYNYPNAQNSINSFVDMLNSNVKSKYPNIKISASIMPETYNSIDYYGQDYDYLSSNLDIIIPMVYKGNYKQDSTWIYYMSQYYVYNSKGADVWIGLQGYVSEDNATVLSEDEFTSDVQNVCDGGASGFVVYRYDLCPYIDKHTINKRFFIFFI